VAVADDGALWCGGENGQIYRIEGDAIELIATTGGFNLGLSFSGDSLFVCDLVRPAVWKFDLHSKQLDVFATGTDDHRLLTPNFPLSLPDGSVLVSDSGRVREPRVGLLRFLPDGTGDVWHRQPINFANGLALSLDRRSVYIAESWSFRILVADVDENFDAVGPLRVFTEIPGYMPDGLTVGPNGDLFVGCYEPSAILRIAPDGTFSVFAHDPTAHLMCHPTGVAIDGDKLVVANLGRWHLTEYPL
jgi:sugar lactone lactonase YvrE